jgi:formylglycine-generating enzyme required for sulfatase activity
LIVLAVLAVLAASQETNPEREIRRWIEELMADDIDLRSKACKALVAAGAKALPALRTAADSTDINVRESARFAAERILWNLRHEPIRIYLDDRKSVKLDLLRIEAGKFIMGEAGAPEAIPHEVTISKDYWLQTTEVTQEQWIAVMERNPSRFIEGGDYPVETVSWEEGKEFLARLNERARNQFPGKKAGFPTEAEWEYACRAGEKAKWCFGADDSGATDYGWFGGNSRGGTCPVGLKKANAWGLFDMHGNVWEWCEDWYGPYERGEVRDPKGPGEGVARCIRGGSWVPSESMTGSAGRSMHGPKNGTAYIGIRVALHQVP